MFCTAIWFAWDHFFFSLKQKRTSFFPFWTLVLISTSFIVDVKEVCFLSQNFAVPPPTPPSRPPVPLHKGHSRLSELCLHKSKCTGKVQLKADPHKNRGHEQSVDCVFRSYFRNCDKNDEDVLMVWHKLNCILTFLTLSLVSSGCRAKHCDIYKHR